MENISNTFSLMLYVMVTNYVLVVACAEEGSLNFFSDRVTEEILYCSNQDYLLISISSAAMIILFLSLRYFVTGESFRFGIPSRYIFLSASAFFIKPKQELPPLPPHIMDLHDS